MFIAHVPSGYILSVSLLERLRRPLVPAASVLWAGMTGALAPDFDLAYFFLVDHRHTHHHKYFTHWPMFWLLLLVIAMLWLRFDGKSRTALLSWVFCLGCTLHVILDSFVGDIWWFAPSVDKPFALFTVQAVFQPWWLNFILHWSFAVEAGICLWAGLLYRRRSQMKRSMRVIKPWPLLAFAITALGLAGCQEKTVAVEPAPAPPLVGADRDAHGCIGSAGYSWCAREKACVRSWELAKEKGFENSVEGFGKYCSSTTP